MIEDAVVGVVARASLGPVSSCVRAVAGRRNSVWFVSTPGLEVVVRFLASADRLVMEQRLLTVVASAGLPVAEVVWTELEPVPVLVHRRLPGRMLSEVDPTDDVCRSVAETLRAIHALPVAAGFGNLRADLTGEAEDLGSWFIDHPDLEAARPLLDRERPALVHGDIQPANLLIGDDGRVSGILDWEAAKSGPPAFDFGWWDWYSACFGTPWPTERLLAHYGDVPNGTDELRRLVMQRIESRR